MFSSPVPQLHCKLFAKMGDDRPFVCNAPGCGQVSFLPSCLGLQVCAQFAVFPVFLSFLKFVSTSRLLQIWGILFSVKSLKKGFYEWRSLIYSERTWQTSQSAIPPWYDCRNKIIGFASAGVFLIRQHVSWHAVLRDSPVYFSSDSLEAPVSNQSTVIVSTCHCWLPVPADTGLSHICDSDECQ